ncbi:SDR family NAD(P)-dependent oxidoreductase [Meiothermus sp. QL-1]|uniref:SDR family NAD(P)-dependent oxidoreductase n=1 Tax=Meiothermus sp. QL-1 TaxID=2058095 RepID=UPI0018F26FC5|nr:SDR family NAD(P)-dependent oxidoreductase [Meiothermus sp. QL-1]
MSKVIVITGASDGIGAAAARQLAAKGWQVVVVGRSPEKTAAVARELNAPYHVADFTELAQVRRLASELLAAYPRIDVLANNAGGLFKKARTKDGFEKTFQVNHLAGFLLTNLLIDRLIESKAKIIQTSSIGAKIFGNIDLDDFTGYTKKNPMNAYGDSKLANILFTKELHRRYHSKGISAVAFHPGNIISNFAHDYSIVQFIYRSPIMRPFCRLMLETPEDGGARLAWFAEGTPGKDWLSGEYYEKNKIPPKWKIHPQANDVQLAKELWERSEKLAGLPVKV